jgi:hypothetical protein
MALSVISGNATRLSLSERSGHERAGQIDHIGCEWTHLCH